MTPEERFCNLPPDVRRDTMESLAMRPPQEERYTVNLTEEDVAAARAEFSENVFAQEDAEAAKKAASQVYTDQIKYLKERRKALRGEIKTALREERGMLYYIDDQETGWLYTYDENGILLGQRRLRPEERQTRITALPMQYQRNDD